jgi:uncharacterized membrane protein
MLNYLLYIFYTTPLAQRLPGRHVALMCLSTASVLFSCYLLYVLKFVLKDFCIVCTTFHIINFTMFALCYSEFRRASHATPKPRPKAQ